jgi:hypothetical protein
MIYGLPESIDSSTTSRHEHGNGDREFGEQKWEALFNTKLNDEVEILGTHRHRMNQPLETGIVLCPTQITSYEPAS